MKQVGWYVGAVLLLFAGLMLLVARSPASVILITAGIAGMFVTAYSRLRSPTSPTEGTPS